MKNIIGVLILIVLVIPVFAIELPWTPTNRQAFQRVNVPTLGATAVVTFDGGTFISYDLTARGGNIRWLPVDLATWSAYQTIISGETKSDPRIPVLWPKNTTWYFTPERAMSTLEVHYWYY
jgi:hypothetical protein